MGVKIHLDIDDLEVLLEKVVQRIVAQLLELPLDQRRALMGVPAPDNDKTFPEWDTATRIARRISALGDRQITSRYLTSARQRGTLVEGRHYRLCNDSSHATPSGHRYDYSFTACCEYFKINI